MTATFFREKFFSPQNPLKRAKLWHQQLMELFGSLESKIIPSVGTFPQKNKIFSYGDLKRKPLKT